MQYFKSTKRRRFKRLYIAVAVISILTFLFLYFIDMQIKVILKDIAEYQAKVYAVQAINDSLNEELEDSHYDYTSLVNVEVGENGVVSSIQTNMLEINRLSSNLTSTVSTQVAELQSQSVDIPLGTLLGWQIFSGKGPDIKFEILPIGFVESKLFHTFETAGINQTVHQVQLEFIADILVVIPGYSAPATVSTDICLAETVIVGLVPEVFFEILDNTGITPEVVSQYVGDSE